MFRKRRLLVSLPRQEGKTELGVRLIKDLITPEETRTALFLAKNKLAAKKAAYEKFMRLFPKTNFEVNTEQVYNKGHVTARCYVDSVDKDPDRIRGGTYHFIHWSEVAFSQFEKGVTVFDVVDKILKPTLRKTNGYAYLESTNNGLNGWHELWHQAEDYGFSTFSLSLSDLVYMGLVSAEEYERLKSDTHPDVFRQEYECEWVTFQGKVYNEFEPQKHVKDIPYPESWQRVIAGIDWGYEDATCVLFAYVKDGVTHVFDEIYLRQKTLEEVLTAIFEHYTKVWHCSSLAAAADHEPARNEELIRRGIPCAPAKKANVLGNRLEIKEKFWRDEILIHPRCKYLLRDLQAAVWDAKKTNEIDESQCTWGHFDAEAALRYLIRELSAFEEEEPTIDPNKFTDNVSSTAWKMRKMREMEINGDYSRGD